MRKHRKLMSVLVVAAIGTSMAGCGDDGTTTATDGDGSSASLSNPMLSSPMYKSGMEAAVASVNADGGIDGRKLVLEFCDSMLDANKESACARELTSKGIVAAVGPNVVADQSGAPYKIYAAAKVPVFGGNGLSPAELTDANSYPMASGTPGWFFGAGKALQAAGARSVAIYADAGPSGQFAGKLASDGLKNLDIASKGVTFADAKADPTFAASAAKVVGTGADGVLIASTNVPVMVKALRDSGFEGRMSTFSGALTDKSIKAMGASGDGLLVSSQNAFVADTENPQVARFVADMKKYAPDAAVEDRSLNAYAKVMLFAQILKEAETADLDGAKFSAVLEGLETPVETGLLGPWAVKGRTSPLSDFPRILNPTVTLGEIRDGKVVPTGDPGFIVPFAG